MKILIVKTSAIGDVTHTLPALNAIRRRYPDAHISWLVEEAAAGVVEGHRAVDRVLVSKRKQWIRLMRQGEKSRAMGELFGFIRELRCTDYDLLLDFQNLLKSGIFVGLAKARRKVGFGKGMEHAEWSHLFLNERIAPVSMDIHAVDRELLLLRAMGIETQNVVFDFPVDQKSEEQTDSLLMEAGLSGDRPMVAINPVATWETKCWFDDRVTAVAEEIARKGYAVVFTGAASDRTAMEGMMRSLPPGRATNLAGRTTLKSLAALYKKAWAVVSTDTGPMHIAASVNTPVVALFGPTAPWRTGPYGKGHRVLRVDLPCSPCFRKHCEVRECMKQLTPEDVVDALVQLEREKGR